MDLMTVVKPSTPDAGATWEFKWPVDLQKLGDTDLAVRIFGLIWSPLVPPLLSLVTDQDSHLHVRLINDETMPRTIPAGGIAMSQSVLRWRPWPPCR